MSSDSGSARSEAPSAESGPVGTEPRVLLFMPAGRNRELLVEALGERYRVETTTDVETLETDFDCCIFDHGEFNRVAGTVQSKRDTSSPVFLPFVLLVDEDADEAMTRGAREYVDDVIELPVEKADLLSRVDNLVERRRTAARLAQREAQLERTVTDLKLKERAMDEAPVGITITESGPEDNPLIYLNALLKETYDGEDPPESFAKIESTAADLIGLAETINEIDQALSGGTGAVEPVELTERTEQLIGALGDRFPDATFELTYPDDDQFRVAVPGFVSAIEEAVENAVKHDDSAEPVVEIRLESRSEGWIDVEIEDSGPGIPGRELDVLGEGETPLNHADRLGLWFIYWVVNRGGGRFSVAESDPRGTILTLSVPRYDGQ